MRKQTTDWEKILVKHVFDKGLIYVFDIWFMYLIYVFDIDKGLMYLIKDLYPDIYF